MLYGVGAEDGRVKVDPEAVGDAPVEEVSETKEDLAVETSGRGGAARMVKEYAGMCKRWTVVGGNQINPLGYKGDKPLDKTGGERSDGCI